MKQAIIRRNTKAALSAALCCLPATTCFASDWNWLVIPYLWGTDTNLDASLRDQTVIETQLGFDDLIDKLDVAAQLHVEGMRGRGGFFLDVTYLDTSDSRSGSTRLSFGEELRVRSAAETLLVEAAAIYRPLGEPGDSGLDLFAGARVVDLELDIQAGLSGAIDTDIAYNTGDTLVDGFIGIRYQAMLSDHWTLSLRGDVATGDTDFSWNTSALLAYHFGQHNRFSTVFGYRHLELDMDTSGRNARAEVEMTMSGPMAGFAFRF